MIEKHLNIPTLDGAMNSFVVCPDEGGPFPVVLFYMDAPGYREELRDMARRIASVGYYVVLPNLYYRRSLDYVLKERTEAGMAEMFTHMGSLTQATTHVDTKAMLDFVATESLADASKIGAVGYCMSGPFVVWAAGDFQKEIKCIASIYGARMVTDAPNSPHLEVTKLRCESYHACAEIDKWASPEQVATLEKNLQANQAATATPYRLEWYAGAEHGFAFPERHCYQKSGAERHWVRLFDLFKRNL